MPDSSVSPTWEIREGDALERLRAMPDESVHCCITSPPYFGLRDYGVDGQIGLESTPEEFVDKLVGVFEEVRRVLRADGTLWLNLGDSYAGGGNGSRDPERWPKQSRNNDGDRIQHAKRATGLKNKDLIGAPWMVAFALRAEGWYLRSEVIWSKPNPMPESVTDRPTKAHEQLFLLSKSSSYYYDAQAIREPAVAQTEHDMRGTARVGIPGRTDDSPSGKRRTKMPDGWDTGPGGHGTIHRDGRESGALGEIGWDRNKRSVWTIPTQPYPEAHFATFPPKLIEPCILAGCPEGGTVLDPFSGAGTTGVVALRRGRSYIGIELNPIYGEMSRERLRADAPLLNTIAEVAA